MYIYIWIYIGIDTGVLQGLFPKITGYFSGAMPILRTIVMWWPD